MTRSENAPLEPELLDDPGLPLDQTDRALADLERANCWLLGIGASLRTLLPRLRKNGSSQMLIDLGTGTGQVSTALQRGARKKGVELGVIGVDRKLSHLLAARSRDHGDHAVVACASALPFRSKSVDWTFSNLLFHHFQAATNSKILAEMIRVARNSAVVVDLRQSKVGCLLARWLLPLLGLGPVAYYDGKLSVDQAWKVEQVRDLVGDENVAELRTRFPVRFSLVIKPDANLARREEGQSHPQT